MCIRKGLRTKETIARVPYLLLDEGHLRDRWSRALGARHLSSDSLSRLFVREGGRRKGRLCGDEECGEAASVEPSRRRESKRERGDV